ncbi:uncharacterized protein UV8b_02908 [Ustilaginoidea virens]|uniref:Uncharacterized protein n=1 Tax=Ustilaginoidea virens TaxID=1159556 RepID=A0A8E5MGL0_USTVR|nr:uncharacterized protein UV8b_02908 [Ustilaginoidea virens]QUC18667.1 hypothetical protein UV8b_02908 [Ustilaginoidea virens]
MNGSSRAAPPPPLNLQSSPPPNSSSRLKFIRANTADSGPASLANSKRSASYSSAASSSFSSSFSSLRRITTGFIKSSPTVNVHTTCGRHTDQLLFSGPSLKDLARSIRKRF